MTLQTVQLKVQALSTDAFRPYGKVLGLDQPLYPEMEVGRLVMELELVRPRSGPGGIGIPSLACHPSYNQIYLQVRGSLVLPVAPPPRNLTADPAEWEFDWDRLAAFVVQTGQGFIIDKGTWHTVVGLGEDSMMVIVSREGHGIERRKPGAPIFSWRYDTKRDKRVIQLVV